MHFQSQVPTIDTNPEPPPPSESQNFLFEFTLQKTPPPVIAAASGSPGGPAAGQVQDEATSALLKELGQIKVESKETIVTPPVVEAAAVSRPPIQQQAPVVQQTFQAPPPKQYVPPSAPTTFTQTPKLAQPGQVSFRNQFSQYLQTLQIRGAPICIFLGVGRGMFAQEMMNSFPGIFYLIDPFIHVWKGYDDPSNVGDKEQQMIFEDLRLRLESNPQLTNRYMIVRDFSYSFVDNFENATMDPNQQPAFVYIDANHAEYAFERDVKMWWPIVAQGGVMAGSTYVDSTDGRIKVITFFINFKFIYFD